MKIRIGIEFLLVIGSVSLFTARGLAYGNVDAHPALNSAAVDAIEKMFNEDPKRLVRLSLTDRLERLRGPAVTNPGFFEGTTGESEKEFTPKEWIVHGGFSADEPEVPAAVRHFYDPLGLNGGKKYLTNRGTYWEGLYSNPGIDAIEWALGDTPKGSDNTWSAAKGKQYFVKAFAEQDQNKRQEYLAKAWRCLGEVLHNTADMLCPPHVRNDSHAAPLGLAGGWLLGSPDPYEELFRPAWVGEFASGAPDPNLSSTIRNATKIRQIHEAVATFTNANFFSHQTISGIGVEEIKPANGENAYPSPKLEDLEYVEEEFTYYKTFASGRRVKMCKDKSYFRFRGYPYIDLDCARSQASELVPNFIYAAKRVFELYLPPIEVAITNLDKETGELEGLVSSRKTDEYPDQIVYNGEVSVWLGNKVFKANCEDGEFNLTIPEGDRNKKPVHAVVSMGGISYYSPDYEPLSSHVTLTFTCYPTSEATFPEGFVFDPDAVIKWVDNSFRIEREIDDETKYEYHSLHGELSANRKYVLYVDYFYYEIWKNEEQGHNLSDERLLSLSLYDGQGEVMNIQTSGSSKVVKVFLNKLNSILTDFDYTRIYRTPIYDDQSNIIGVKEERIESSTIDFSRDPFGGQYPVFQLIFYD